MKIVSVGGRQPFQPSEPLNFDGMVGEIRKEIQDFYIILSDFSPLSPFNPTSAPHRDGGLPKKLGLQLNFWVHSFHATPIGLMLIS